MSGTEDGRPLEPSITRPIDPTPADPIPAEIVRAHWLAVNWPLRPSGLAAWMTSRGGGLSPEPWAASAGGPALNLGLACGDEAGRVAANRKRVEDGLGLPVLWLNQVHGHAVVDVDKAPPPDSQALPRADAAFTTRSDIALAILVADCLPVLVASDDGRIIGAAHAGWRGLAGGVLPALVEAMRERLPGVALQAWLGPRIGATVFEVGPEVKAAFVARKARFETCFMPSSKPGHFLGDLGAIARLDLADVGIGRVADSGLCTQREGHLFWSHRRDQPGGRMAALIRRLA